MPIHNPEAPFWASPITHIDYRGGPHVILTEQEGMPAGLAFDIAYLPPQKKTPAATYVEATVTIPDEDQGEVGVQPSDRFIAFDNTDMPPWLDRQTVHATQTFWAQNEVDAHFIPEHKARDLGLLALVEVRDGDFRHQLTGESDANHFTVTSRGIVLATGRALMQRAVWYLQQGRPLGR